MNGINKTKLPMLLKLFRQYNKKKMEDRECDSRVFGRIIKIVKLESAGYSNIPTKQKIKK